MIRKKISKILFPLLSIALLGCSKIQSEPISKTGLYFDTVIKIDIYDSSDQELLTQCFSLFPRVLYFIIFEAILQ